MTEPVLVGDVAIFFGSDGSVLLRGGGDGRMRIVVPAGQCSAVAAAVAGSGFVVIDRGRVERLVAVEAAAREYAESRRSWEALLPVATESGVPVDEWDAAQRRQDAARATLISLFATPDPPNAQPEESAGDTEREGGG